MSLFNNAIIGASGQQGYQISRSVRLRSSASAYFNRTPASAGNSQKFTWSGWVKRGSLSNGTYPVLFMAGNTQNDTTFCLNFNASDQLTVRGYTGAFATTTAVYRDPSAWYHIVAAVDTTNATASNRFLVYVNGVLAASGTVSQNWSFYVNTAINHTIGNQSATWGFVPFDGYITECNFVDGQQLTPSSFGETDAVTGVWKPKKYAGTYGTNGFYLNFSDNSAATAAAIGKDSSGNGNNWTPNNISVTAGATYDSMLDVPTPYADGGNGRGNYCVMNPLDKDTACSVAGGNLDWSSSVGGAGQTRGTFGMTSGKWYWEVLNTIGGNLMVSLATAQAGLGFYAGNDAYGWGYYSNSGTKYTNGSSSAYGATNTVGDVIGVAFDADVGSLTFYKNGVSQGVAFTGLTNGPYFASVGDGSTSSASSASLNFGQRPFAYTPPTGFKALNTQNLPDSTIKKGSLYFDVVPYAGDATYPRTVGGLNFQPDLVWIKSRSTTYDHVLYDSVRGTGTGANLMSNQTYAEGGDSVYANLTAFTASGFTVGTVSSTNILNSLGNYVAWQWKKGATQGFDVVTYSGTLSSTGTASINHNLGVAPSMIISKARAMSAQDNGQWVVRHTSLGNWNKYLRLNTTDATVDSTANGSMSAPTSTTFPTNWTSGMNASSPSTYVAYLFAEVAGFSKFGSYTGNGSADGPFVYCGFRPRFVMYKRTDSTGSWQIEDTSRSAYNVANAELFANLNIAEYTTAGIEMDILSNGFKVRNTNADRNASGGTYIFAAFAENPFKNSLAR